MIKREYAAGQIIIKEGWEGTEMFVVEAGTQTCFKINKETGKRQFLRYYNPGEMFGELALMYNMPRAASIEAKTNSVLYVDQETFDHNLKQSTLEFRQQYEEFLNKISLFEDLTSEQKQGIINQLKYEEYRQGQYDKADKFYIVEDGLLSAQMNGINIVHYGPGNFFGEKALFENKIRQYSIFCKTDAKLAYIDKETFTRTKLRRIILNAQIKNVKQINF